MKQPLRFHSLLACCFTLATSCLFAQTEQPNILLVLTDDVGLLNIGAYHRGLMSSKTPYIDSIAEEGMLFTDYYAQPSCTAGRSAMITGQFPVRTGMHTVGLPGDPIGLSPDTPTIAELLKGLGYRTGQFGKNHLGDQDEFLPTMHGFDEFWGWLYHLNAMEYTSDPEFPKGEAAAAFTPRNVIHAWSTLPPERMKTLDDEVNKHTLKFIRDSVSDKEPFFVWYCPSRAHVWTYLSPKYEAMLGQDGMGLQEVVMKDLDDHLGVILDELDALGVADNTIVIFSADNGPELITWPDGGMTPFRSEKGTTWEGGVRAPMLMSWPGKIKPGSINNGIMDAMDLLPTLVAAAGGPEDLKEQMLTGYNGHKAHLDGYNQLDMLTGNGESKRKEIIYYERTTLQAVRYGDWKAHFIVQNEGWAGAKEELNAPLLFNLRQDPLERAADESGMYIEWMGKKMWAFGPAQRIVQKHLATFEEWPPASPSAKAHAEKLEETLNNTGGLGQ
jgi:arylsulfatase A-like enzyme